LLQTPASKAEKDNSLATNSSILPSTVYRASTSNVTRGKTKKEFKLKILKQHTISQCNVVILTVDSVSNALIANLTSSSETDEPGDKRIGYVGALPMLL
jgi:hypothetical protein